MTRFMVVAWSGALPSPATGDRRTIAVRTTPAWKSWDLMGARSPGQGRWVRKRVR
ncbi:hypothetical protein [Nonomuraea sp. NPDC005501]|uniref:hypothetical protein n=1 Tax=Nonomuraea sp. NPDC005501 TaxID=3156884 RepID=UPI0033A2CEDE